MGRRPPGTVLSERSKKKKRFFKGDKPFIRKFEIEDMWVLWAAYKEGSFPQMPEMEREEFYSTIRARLGNYMFLFLVEDNNRKFKAGIGAVCLIGANTDGWKFEPHVEYFKWATKYNIIRTTLCFLNWISFNKDVGVCIIRSLENTVNLFRYMKEYIGLNYVGMIHSGDIRGDEYLFSLKGKKHGNEPILSEHGKKPDGVGTSSKRVYGNRVGTGSASTSTAGSDRDTGEKVSGV